MGPFLLYLEGNLPSFNISPKLRRELIDLASILKGNTIFPTNIRNASEYLSDREFYAQQFLIGVRDDDITYKKAYQLLMRIAGENNYPHLTEKIAEIADYVLRSDLPQDNLWRSYSLPKNEPSNILTTAVISIATGIGKFVSWIWSIILHDKVYQFLLVVFAIIFGFVFSYIQYPTQTCNFLNYFIPWLHLKPLVPNN